MRLSNPNLLAEIVLPQWMVDYPYAISAAIVVLGICLYGFKDLVRLSIGRIWAISGVCFRDAIRRRVLWITPLAMLAVVIVSQLQNADDEADAIRQTIKFCFFTSGIVVTVIALITAATNLQREIENRVIFTIVTKPVTRLEIVIGKLVGFGRVSAAILLIMGLFTAGYLHLRSWSMQSAIAQRLQDSEIDQTSRTRLEYFQREGLLNSRSIHEAITLTQYARVPDEKNGKWMAGGKQDALISFHLNEGDLFQGANPQAPAGSEKAYFFFDIKTERLDQVKRLTRQTQIPEVQIQIWDAKSERLLFPADQISPKISTSRDSFLETYVPLDGFARIAILPQVARQLEIIGDFKVQLVGVHNNFLYQVDQKSVSIIVGNLDDPSNAAYGKKYEATSEPIMAGGQGQNYGQTLAGKDLGIEPVAVFSFKNANDAHSSAGNVPFEMKVAIDKNGDNDVESDTVLAIQVKDNKTNQLSEQKLVYPENRKVTFFTLPEKQIASGDFDLYVRCLNPGHELELYRTTLLLVADRQPFALNLFKGLFVLWMFSLLVASIAFLTSTFLSWPIAVVLTIFIILGKWIVMNLDIGTGIGAQFAQEYFQSDTTASTVVNQTVETLTRALTIATIATPQIDSFGVTELVEKGVSISWSQVNQPLWILLLYGLPFLTFSYVILRNKEVAP